MNKVSPGPSVGNDSLSVILFDVAVAYNTDDCILFTQPLQFGFSLPVCNSGRNMMMRAPFLFVIDNLRIVIRLFLYGAYSLLWQMLQIVEQSCWNLENWMYAYIEPAQDIHAVPYRLRVINYGLRQCWKLLMRLIAIVYICYMSTGEGTYPFSYADFQVLACTEADGPNSN